MLIIPGYKIQSKLFEGNHTLIFRAKPLSGNHIPVVIKILKDEYPTPSEVARFKHEFEINQSIKDKGVTRAYSMEKIENTFAITLEDFGGTSLDIILANGAKMTLVEFLPLAIHITETLGQIHKMGITHKDINPSNIVLNLETKEAKIIDFGISSMLPNENPAMTNVNYLEGTLAYLSPEQTGRMNRGVDYRTDFYSLGITFFKMLTGELPFESEDPLELVHHHMAVLPKTVHEIDATIPEMISKIIAKLVAKNAEDRYQSAHGLLFDLMECMIQHEASGHIQNFELATHDLSSKLSIPGKLYGRENEIQILLDNFNAASESQAKLLIVTGYSGVGKSALVHEVYKPITKKHGYFVSGKFDQYKKNVPYGPLVQSLEKWLQQISMEGEEALNAWKEKLLTALNPNSGVVTEIIPAFETILGKASTSVQLSSGEAQNRFDNVFVKLIQTVATPEHPLVLFLDDLQWADPRSLQVMIRLLTSIDTRHLLIVGAYRDNEVDSAHILNIALSDLTKNNVAYQTLVLSPLPITDVNHLLKDTLHTTADKVQSLAELCYTKTHGNPFFLIQMLQSWHQENLIHLDVENQKWAWNTEEIKKKNVSDNVIDLMTDRLNKLSKESLRMLQFASCIGFNFDLQTISTIIGKSYEETADVLWESLHEGLIIPEDENYKYAEESHLLKISVKFHFLHDRVQQAAYSMMAEEERDKTHYRIGKLLLQNTPKDKLAENIFTIVNQLNAGISCIHGEEVETLAALNLQAGTRAKHATAFLQATHYLNLAKEKLPKDHWETKYEMSVNLFKMLAESLYLTGEFKTAEAITEEHLQHSKTNLEKAWIHQMKVIQYTTCGQMEEAIEQGLKGLKLLDLDISKEPQQFTLAKEILITKNALRGKDIAKLIDLPVMTDERALCKVSIMIELILPAFFTNRRNLTALAILYSVQLALKFGNCSEVTIAYTIYAALLTSLLWDFIGGYEFAKLALAVDEKLGNSRYRTSLLYLSNMNVLSWNESWTTLHDKCRTVIEQGLQTGNLIYTVFGCLQIDCWRPDAPLDEVAEEMHKYALMIEESKYEDMIDDIHFHLGYRLNLLGKTKGLLSYSHDDYDEDSSYKRMMRNSNINGMTAYHIMKCITAYTFEDYDTAYDHANKAYAGLDSVISMPLHAEYCFYSFLTYLQIYHKLSLMDKVAIGFRLKVQFWQMTQWAENCSANFSHKKLLMEAELQRTRGNIKAATHCYEEAITASKKYDFIAISALANELAAKFNLEIGQSTAAKIYFRNAQYDYTRWNAIAKLNHLKENYAAFMKQDALTTNDSGTTIGKTLYGTHTQVLDLNTVLKASQAISGEMILSDLLEKMMHIVIENAGAEKGWLILENKGQWLIEAEGRSDSKVVKVLHSESIDKLPASILQYAIYNKTSVLLADASQDKQFAHDPYIQQSQIKSVLCVPLINQGVMSGLLYLENNIIRDAFTQERLEVLNMTASQIAISVKNARLFTHTSELNESLSALNTSLAKTNEIYEQFVPREFLSILGKKSILDVVVGDHILKEMTILFSDIRNFTSISETMSPAQNFQFLNKFLSYMEPIISRHQGFVDKYLGDGIMALFPSDADSALKSAIAMLKMIEIYNVEQRHANHFEVQIGLGLNSGSLMLGTVGGKHHMEGTVVSDAVNIASRVQDLTKQYETKLLITNETYARLKDPSEYCIREVENVHIRGKSKPIIIYEVFDADPEIVRDLKQQTMPQYLEAMALYHAGKFKEASILFKEIAIKNPEDLLIQYLRKVTSNGH